MMVLAACEREVMVDGRWPASHIVVRGTVVRADEPISVPGATTRVGWAATAGSGERPRPGDPPPPGQGSGSGRVVHQLALSVGVRLMVH